MQSVLGARQSADEGYDPIGMPENLDASLVMRQSLEGAYALLTFRHAAVAREGRAGQFVMIKASTVTEPLLRRPFSIMSVDPQQETFTIFLKAVGPGSRALADLRSGEGAPCLGPLGRPFSAPPAGHEAVMVAGGYGIAPFHLFCEQLVREGRPARVFYGGRTAGDLQVREPFARLGVPLATSTEDGSHGQRGKVTEPLSAYLDGARGPVTLYASGPSAMLRAVAEVAAARGLTAQVSLDPWMGCGVGTCLGCVVWIQRGQDEQPHRRCACTEGPVFDSADVVWSGEHASRARRAALAAAGSAP
jgi:dihydroorotate dehydrogenase electron transfer subunit